MAFSDKLKDMIDQGLDFSKDFLEKAGAKAKELGELGMLKVEIFQLKGKAKNLSAALGAIVYQSLVEKKEGSLSVDSPAIRETLQKLDLVEKEIDVKEADFKAKGGKEDDLKTPPKQA